ncbi:helix-turn-helix domain-containing protein [Rheinheimera salexigens]|uniref:HTH cro/C1-type domain-containing protein n=1 Tax=Rheinheimera salexigens TaxID=1628148 RepID=A0A1E7Q8I9_9GAMM|nr:helix-turn-helix transcriptional regulator [Rheinheimera salexigens]OEY70358.1 hypothetical protein BI198_12825 [Rheinheimera salexigens]
MINLNSFSKRLLESVEGVGIKRHGAGNWLAVLTKVTVKAANKWLNGESIPRRENLEIIAKSTKVRVEWLQYGEGAKTTSYVNENISDLDALIQLATPRTQTELLKIAEAAADGRLTEDDVKLLKVIADRLIKKE